LGSRVWPDAIPSKLEGVVGVLVDLLAAVCVVVVVSGVCAERLEEVVVLGTAGRQDLVASKLAVLNSERAGGR
jgi:hypothetical protein